MNKLLTLVNIRPNEGRLVLLVLLYGLLTETIDTLIHTVSYALFLNEFDAQRLPYIYIGASILTTLISVFSLHLSRRYSLAQLLFGQIGFILLTVVGYRMGFVVFSSRWFLFTLPIWYGLVNTIMFTTFWNLLGRLFNLQQGKRLFGLLGIGKEVAALTSGFLIPGFVALVGTLNLLWLAALVTVVLLWLLRSLARHSPTLWTPPEAEPEIEATDSDQTPAHQLWADPYIRLIFALYLVFGLGDYFVDNIFYTQVESQFTTQDQLASFLGIFTGMIAVISLGSQLFLSNWIMSRYGVRTAILLTPALLFLGIFPFAIIGTISPSSFLLFWLMVSLNLTRYVTNTTDNIAANLMYQPLPSAARTRLQTMIDGIIYPVAAGLTGLILLGLTNILGFTAVQLAYVLLPILVAWVLIAFALGGLYPKRVQQALRQRLLSGNGALQTDRASLESIRQNLANPHPGAVIYALTVLETMDTAELAQSLPPLLNHPSVPVRLDVLTRLERLGGMTALPVINQLFHTDPEPSVRTAALRTIATLGGVEHFEEMDDYLTGGDLPLRQSVMVGLLRNGELESILAVGGSLTGLVNSALAAERGLAAQVLGESGLANFYRPLLKLLYDPEPQVQRAALLAAGKLQQPKLWPMVCAQLAAPHTRSAAQRALVAAGDAALPALQSALAQAGQDRQFRLAVVRTAGRIRSQQAIEILLPQLHFPDSGVRTQTLLALQQCSYQANPAARPMIEAQIQAELAQVAWILAGLADLTSDAAPTLLYTALARNLTQQRERLLLLLSFIYDATTVRRVRDAFGRTHGNAAEQRAYAMETLDMLVAKPISRNLLPLFDDLLPAQQLKQIATDFPQPALSPPARVAAIIAGTDSWVSPWLKSVAIYTAITPLFDAQPLVSVERRALHTAMVACLPAAEALVQETATWALARLDVDAPVRGEGIDKPGINKVGVNKVGVNKVEVNKVQKNSHGGVNGVLLTIEKVMILNTVEIFAQTPDEILIDIAALLKELTVPADTTIFEQGEQGESMYIIVEGEVEARDGERVFTRMGERQVFGEMALLDGEPRTATIRTTQATRLLRLDQEPFYELMDDRIEIARGVIRVLLQRLRARTNDVNQLRAQLKMP